jgi:hypothetical protein
MRQVRNWKTPLIATAILVALACLPVLGNLSVEIVKRETQKKEVVKLATPDRVGTEVRDDKAHE